MADMAGCSSSHVENPEVEEMRENIPPGATTPSKRQYLCEEYFPDISLLDSTCSLDMHQTMDELSLRKNMPTTPLTASTLGRTPDWMREIINNNSKFSSIRTPMVKAKGSQPRNLDADASMVLLRDECLPDITNCSLDSTMQRSINFTINISPSDMQLLNSAQKAPIESDLERAFTFDESTSQTFNPPPLTASQGSLPQNKEPHMPTPNQGPTLGSGPTEQDDLPSGNTTECKTSVTSDNSTITRSTESSLNDGHHNTFDANSLSVSNAASESNSSGSHHNTFDANPHSLSHVLSESNSSGSHHNTFDAKPPSRANGTLTLSDSCSGDRHHNTFDANPPSQSNSTLSMSEHGSNDNPLDTKPPCQSTGQTKTSESSSGDCRRNTFDAKPPSRANGILLDGSSSDCHRHTFDAKLPSQSNGKVTSQSRLSNGHHDTFDANPPSQSSSTLSMSESCSNDSHHNTFDVQPAPKSNKSTSESSSSDRHHNTFDANPPPQSDSALPMPEHGSDDSHLNALDAKPPCQSDGKTKTSQSGSTDSHHDTFDANPPSQSKMTLLAPEGGANDSLHGTFDAKPPQSSSKITSPERTSNEDHCNNTFDTYPPPKNNGTVTTPESHSSDGTFNAKPPQSSGKITTSESQSSDCHQNSFDVTPKPNRTMSMSENHSSDARHSTFDAKAKNMPESCCGDSHPNTVDSKPPSHPGDTDPNADANAGETNLGEASASAASHCEAKDHSQSLTHDRSLYPDDNSKAFNLDDTLELRRGNFATSTPLTTANCKMAFSSPRTDESKLLALQQNLGLDTASKPQDRATSDVAADICGPKILFQSQPPAKSLLPSLKAPTLSLMVKQSTVPPGRGLPLVKRSLIPHTLKESSAVSNLYNLRPTTIASRPNTHQPKPGVEKPQLGGKLSSIPRGPALLKPPLRSSTLASSADKKYVPTSSSNIVIPGPSMHAISAMRSSRQAPPRHTPMAKTAKDDAAACDAVTRPKSLKPLVKSQRNQLPKASGCVKCIILERQLQMQTEELQRLKEELQKHKNEKDM
ncbi:uncharacterized protein LOC144038290 isoform X2 [Vanacampus margaritifer]